LIRINGSRRYAPYKFSSDNSEGAMPYPHNSDLPPPIRTHLPAHAQDIYREAFNHAYAAHKGDPRREEIAHRTAWSAVKRSYVKAEGAWVPRHKTGAV
jgi:cation transport regulator